MEDIVAGEREVYVLNEGFRVIVNENGGVDTTAYRLNLDTLEPGVFFYELTTPTSETTEKSLLLR